MQITSSSDFSYSKRSIRNKIFQYGAGGTALLNTTEINFQQNGFLLLEACELCIPSYQQPDSNLSSVAQCLKSIGQHLKYPYLLELTPGAYSHHTNMSNWIEIMRVFWKGYIVKSSLASGLVWLGHFCCWCCLLFLLSSSYSFYSTWLFL